MTEGKDKSDDELIIHPWKYIKDTGLSDGDWVEVFVKDKRFPENDDQKEWYEKAFGSHRNIMTINFKYDPKDEADRRYAGMKISFDYYY